MTGIIEPITEVLVKEPRALLSISMDINLMDILVAIPLLLNTILFNIHHFMLIRKIGTGSVIHIGCVGNLRKESNQLPTNISTKGIQL